MEIKEIKYNKQLKQAIKKRTVEELLEFGIINIDKSSGPTSFNISDFVRKELNSINPDKKILRKTSHFGTLDPKVTGVLPVALNRACKLTGYFIGEDKEYVGIMRMHEEVDLELIKKIINEKFMGKIRQTPPVKSRVKREERTREIKSFEILEKDNKDFLFKVECQGGTYIRKLIDDLGKELNMGAHMLELRRIRAGIYNEDDEQYPAVNLYDLEKAVDEYKKGNTEELRKIIIPAEVVSSIYPIVEVKKKNLKKFFTGRPIHDTDVKKMPEVEEDEKVSVFCGTQFIGMYKKVDLGEIIFRSEFVKQPIK